MSAIEQHGRCSPETPRDARARRTRRALHGAMGALLHERPFEAIAIKQILARADVARSTFYAHFDSKEELLASAMEEVMERGGSASDNVLSFALPLLEHIEASRAHAGPPAAQLGFHRHAHATLHEAIRAHVGRVLARGCAGDTVVPAALVSDHVASTFIVVLEWWLTSAPGLTAREAHRHIEELVAAALRPVPAR